MMKRVLLLEFYREIPAAERDERWLEEDGFGVVRVSSFVSPQRERPLQREVHRHLIRLLSRGRGEWKW